MTSISLGGKALVAASSTELMVTTYLIQFRIPESVLALVLGQLPKIAAKSASSAQLAFFEGSLSNSLLKDAANASARILLGAHQNPRCSSVCAGFMSVTSNMTLEALSILCVIWPSGPCSRILLFLAGKPS